MPEINTLLDMAREFFDTEDYASAITELETAPDLLSSSEQARDLLAQCEVLYRLNQALEDVNSEHRDDSFKALIAQLDDKRGQPWLQDTAEIATTRLIEGSRSLVESLRAIDTSLADPLLTTLSQALSEKTQNMQEIEEKSLTGIPMPDTDQNSSVDAVREEQTETKVRKSETRFDSEKQGIEHHQTKTEVNKPMDTSTDIRKGLLDIAYGYFRDKDYTSAINELQSVLQSSSPPSEARRLLAQCEVLDNLERTLEDVVNKQAYEDSANALIRVLEDEREQPWLEEADNEAVRRLIQRGLLLADRFLRRADYPVMRKWLESLHETIPWSDRVTEEYQECEDLVDKVNISRTWVPPADSDDLLYAIAEIKEQLERLTNILQQNPSDRVAQEDQKAQLEKYEEFLQRRSQRIRDLQGDADTAIAEGRFRDARDALNDMLYLSGIGAPEDFEKLSPEEISQIRREFGRHQLNVRSVQAQLRQARDLAEIAKKASTLLDQVEDKLAELEFADGRELLKQLREMELRGRQLSTEMAIALSNARKNMLSDNDEDARLLKEAEKLRQDSMLAHLDILSDEVTEAESLYKKAIQSENNGDFQSAQQYLNELRAGWPQCSEAVDRRLKELKHDIGIYQHVNNLWRTARETGALGDNIKIAKEYIDAHPCQTNTVKDLLKNLLESMLRDKEVYEQYQEGMNEKAQDQLKAELLYIEAEEFLESDPATALEKAKEAVALFPQDEKYKQLAKEATRANAVAEARAKKEAEANRRAAKQRRDNMVECIRTAWVQLGMGNLEEADQAVKDVRALAPTDEEITETLDNIELTNSLVGEALRKAQSVRGISFPESVPPPDDSGKVQDTLEALRSAIRMQQETLDKIRSLMNADVKQAAKQVERFIEGYPNHEDALSLRNKIRDAEIEQGYRETEAEAVAYESKGKLGKAVRLLDEITHNYGASSRKPIWQARQQALNYVLQGDLESARESLSGVARADAYTTWEIIEACERNIKEGRQALERAATIQRGEVEPSHPSELADLFKGAASALLFVRTRMPGSSEVAEEWQQADRGARLEQVRYKLEEDSRPLIEVEAYDSLTERLKTVPDTYADSAQIKRQIKHEREILQRSYERVRAAQDQARKLQAQGCFARAADKFGEATTLFPDFIAEAGETHRPKLWQQLEREIEQNQNWENDLDRADKALTREMGLDDAISILEQLEREVKRSLLAAGDEELEEEFQAFMETRAELHSVVDKMRQALGGAEELCQERKYSEARKVLRSASKIPPPSTPNQELNDALNELYRAVVDESKKVHGYDIEAGEATRRWEEARDLLDEDPAGEDENGNPRNGSNLGRAIELLERAMESDAEPKRAEIRGMLQNARQHAAQFNELRERLSIARAQLREDDKEKALEAWESARDIAQQVIDEPPAATWPISATQREEAKFICDEAQRLLDSAESLQEILEKAQVFLDEYLPKEAIEVLQDAPDQTHLMVEFVRHEAESLRDRMRQVKQLRLNARELKGQRKIEELSRIAGIKEGDEIDAVLLAREPALAHPASSTKSSKQGLFQIIFSSLSQLSQQNDEGSAKDSDTST